MKFQEFQVKVLMELCLNVEIKIIKKQVILFYKVAIKKFKDTDDDEIIKKNT